MYAIRSYYEGDRIRVPDLLKMKRRGQKITVLTAYDATMARLAESFRALVISGSSEGCSPGTSAWALCPRLSPDKSLVTWLTPRIV